MVIFKEVGFEDVPEYCIENVFSFTTPRDVATLSLVSSTFKSAAKSDAVWENFLPSDYHSIISQSSSDVYNFLSSLSKKDLYLNLYQKPILIDHGKKSFQLDKICGKKCYMLSPRSLFIVWGDTPDYWKWTSLPDSRFSEVAELVSVYWFDIRGCINTRMLSPNTLYGAYLVFKASASRASGFEYHPVESSIVIAGGAAVKRSVFLDVERGLTRRYIVRRGIRGLIPGFMKASIPCVGDFEQYPKDRADGWLEMKLGEFFSGEGDDKEVEIGVYEVMGGGLKGGLVFQGIEIRPKPELG